VVSFAWGQHSAADNYRATPFAQVKSWGELQEQHVAKGFLTHHVAPMIQLDRVGSTSLYYLSHRGKPALILSVALCLAVAANQPAMLLLSMKGGTGKAGDLFLLWKKSLKLRD